MRINFQEVLEFCILLGYLRGIMTSQRVLYGVQGQVQACGQRRMSDFDTALTYALERIGRPSVQLKPQQRASIQAVYDGRDVFVWLPTGFGKSICFTTLPFAYDHKRCGTYLTFHTFSKV